MVSGAERIRLTRAYAGEPVCVVALLVRCAACLGILCGMAIAGDRLERTDEPPVAEVRIEASAPATVRQADETR